MIGVFDIGGTHTRTAVSSDGGTLQNIRRFETPQDPHEGISAIVASFVASDISAASADPTSFTMIAGGFPGTLENGVILSASHLPLWQGINLKAALAEHFPGARISLENDADMACLGEAVFGSGIGFDRVGYMTVSTGIGGGRVVKGVIDTSAPHFEPGSIVMDEAEALTLEDLVSGSGVLQRYGRRFTELDRSVRTELAGLIARGIAVCIETWPPDVFVIGGSITLEAEGLVDDILAALRTMPAPHNGWPPLRKATLGDDSGLYGALARAAT